MTRTVFTLLALTILGLSIHTNGYAEELADDNTGSFINPACPMPITEETMLADEGEQAQEDIETYVKTLPPEEQMQAGKVTQIIEGKMKKPVVIAEEAEIAEEPSATGEEETEESEELEIAD
jgi:hypothetical protein